MDKSGGKLTGALGLAVVLGLGLAACTGSHPGGQRDAGQNDAGQNDAGQNDAGQGSLGAGALLASPGRLVDQPVRSTGCGRQPAVRTGSTTRLTVPVPPASAAGQRTREYWLHVPAHYRAGRLTPLVIVLHGGGGTGIGMERTTMLSALGDARGFLVAYPQGLTQQNGRGPSGWNASGPRDPFADGIDDGLFISDMLTAVQAGYCVDPYRIATTGFSNGGSMTGYLACVLANRIAAFAPVEGVFFQIPGGCRPDHPASVLDVHVSTDPVAPYAGVPARGSPDYYALAIPAWLRAWALRDGCRGGPSTLPGTPAVWRGCDDQVAVAGYRLAAGGHSWPARLGAGGGSQTILGFFTAHPLRTLSAAWAAHPDSTIPTLTASAAPVTSVRQFRLPTADAEPLDIAAGPGGDIWFTEFDADKIGRITPSGMISEYRVPTPDAGPYQITAGPGDSMWFTEYNTTKIGRVSQTGQISEFPLPRPDYGGAGITSDPAGSVWVADTVGYIDRITPAGRVSRIKLPPGSTVPFAIARQSSGSIWCSELTGYFEYSRVLARLGPGSATPVPALTLASRMSNIDALAAGPGGTVWFTDFGGNQIGEVGPDGRLRLFADPAPYNGLADIAWGGDGAMWFTEQSGLVGRVNADGSMSQFALPSAGSEPDGITAGPGHTLWIAEAGIDAVVRITTGRS